MKTANQMTNAELMERIGQDADEELAATMRIELNKVGMGDTNTDKIPESIWFDVMDKAIAAVGYFA